jgi:uncharacterized protein YukE/cytoskeletal protein RodZ
VSSPLVAEVKDSTQSFSGVPLMESVNDTSKAIQSGDWASGVLGVAGTALDALSMAVDPFGAIFAAGVGWLIEHVGPLSDALDALTGNADEIKAHSETWKNISGELGKIATDMSNAVAQDTAGWLGEAGDAYRQRAADTANLITAAQGAADGASSGIGTAGEVVGAVRTLVRDIIAELVGHMISWALQVVFTLGIGMAWVVPQVIAAVAKTATKIADLTKKLVQALKKLSPMLSKLGDNFGDATKSLKNIKETKPQATKAPDAPPSSSRGIDGPSGGKNKDSVDNDSSPNQNMNLGNTNSGPSVSSTTPSSSGGNAPTTSSAAPSTSSATPSTSSATPGTSSATPSQTTWLSGTDASGNPVKFTSSQVHSIPLKDANGKTVGISFPTKPDDATKVSSWAKKNRTSDSAYIPDYTSGKHKTPGSSQAAPWGKDPFYVHAHANPNKFAVNVNTAPPGQPPVYQKVRIDGTNHGQLVSSNQHFQAASQANPKQSLVYMSCNSGNPSGSAAADSAKFLHGGHQGDVFAPTGTGSRIMSGGDSFYGVKPGQHNGNTIPGEFKKF